MAEAAPQQGRPIVLVVDDDTALRFLLHETLEMAGFAVEEASDGASALSAVERVRPDLVLLDVRLPGTSGFDVCAAIRKLPNGKAAPILMMTGMEPADSMPRARKAGATDVLGKPIKLSELVDRVKSLLAPDAPRPGQA